MNVATFNKDELSPDDLKFLEKYGINVIYVKLEDPNFNPIHWEEQGDWVDLKVAEDVTAAKEDYYEASLGLAAKVHEGYEVHIEPRSSTFSRYKILMANEMGIIDNSYCGNGDIWHFPLYATDDTTIEKGTRIAQFRVMENMKTMFWGKPQPEDVKNPQKEPDFGAKTGFIDLTEYDLVIVYVDDLGSVNRGGLGSTGV